MTPSATTLPPPLTDTPSVEALERLLAGLHQPMQRGVPSPPAADGTLDLTVLEATPAAAVAELPPPPTAAITRPQRPAPQPPLSWSAGNSHRSSATTVAIGVAVATAAGILAGLAAAAEHSLP